MTTLKSWKDSWDEDPSIFKGCSKIFIDAGSNAGTHIRKLFEPEKYQQSPYLQIFETAFGAPSFRRKASTETGICAFGFDANPQFVSRYQDIEKAYSQQGWRARWFAPFAVSNMTGNVTFWLNELPGRPGGSMDIGASTINRASDDSGINVTVPEVDFGSFLEALRLHAEPGYKLMKMDIEGSEFDVLPELLQRGLLCKGSLDLMTIEWHPQYIGEERLEQAQELMKEVHRPGKCHTQDTKVLEVDDESYLYDGMPLP